MSACPIALIPRTLLVSMLLPAALLLAAPADGADGDPLELRLRSRVETSEGSGRFHVVTEAQQWDPRQTAIIVCDMWDLHHCLNAVRRGTEMAPRMNDLLNVCRERGVTIIHAPSHCMETYQDHPARQRAARTPKSERLPEDIGKWCYQIPSEEQGEYPIDQTDGGEDDDPQEHAAWQKQLEEMGRNPKAPWKSQMDLLEIRNEDYISDSGEEIWSILEERGIDNVILTGVHTNMCVLGRPFGLRQMAKNGKNVVLMRDLTDTMYNPQKAPYVSHFTGTDLIVAHIEKWVCPTITSDQFLGGRPYRFKDDTRPRVAMLIGEDEYRTETTLPPFALEHLGKEFSVETVFASDSDKNHFPGIEAIAEADVLLVSVRRRLLPDGELAVVRQFVESGKPVVAIRTSSHAFASRGGEVPEGTDAWPEFDAEVLGGNYQGHHGEGPSTQLKIAPGASNHPILAGIDVSRLVGKGSLYKTSPLAPSATPLLIGSVPNQSPEPVAWTHESPAGGRVFYTSLGHAEDFEQEEFAELLANAVRWAAQQQ